VTFCRDGIAGGHDFTFFGCRVLTRLDAESVSFDFIISLTFVLSLSFFSFLFTFALFIFDFCMGAVFTEWEYWKSAQPRARVRPMAERPMWPCHSVYRETASVQRTISL